MSNQPQRLKSPSGEEVPMEGTSEEFRNRRVKLNTGMSETAGDHPDLSEDLGTITNLLEDRTTFQKGRDIDIDLYLHQMDLSGLKQWRGRLRGVNMRGHENIATLHTILTFSTC